MAGCPSEVQGSGVPSGRLPAPHVPGQHAQRSAAKVSVVQGRGLMAFRCESAVLSPPPGWSASAGHCPSGGPSCHRGLQPWCPPSRPAAVCPESAGVARGTLLPSLGPNLCWGVGDTPSSVHRRGALLLIWAFAHARPRARLSPVTCSSSWGGPGVPRLCQTPDSGGMKQQ